MCAALFASTRGIFRRIDAYIQGIEELFSKTGIQPADSGSSEVRRLAFWQSGEQTLALPDCPKCRVYSSTDTRLKIVYIDGRRIA